MKRNNKKGFTIVELVIVIAVIAILAGIMIPTFGSIIDKANESEALQKGRALYMEIYAEDLTDGKIDNKSNNVDIDLDTLLGDDHKCTYSGSTAADGTVTISFTYDDSYWAHFDGSDWTTGKGDYSAPSTGN